METTSLFLAEAAPLSRAATLLTGLENAGLLDGGVGAIPDQLDGEEGALFVVLRRGDSSDGAPVGEVAEVLRRVESKGPSRRLRLYFRLRAPETLPAAWRDELEDLAGELEPDPGDFWVTHPFECWLEIDLADIEGRRVAASLHDKRQSQHPSLPRVRIVGRLGDPIDVEGGLELRTQPSNAPYLLLALEKAHVLREQEALLLRLLD